jgi:hypothetical protein
VDSTTAKIDDQDTTKPADAARPREELPEAEFERALAAYAEAEADRRRVRTLMLYRMWRVLSPQQRARLEMFHKQHR